MKFRNSLLLIVLGLGIAAVPAFLWMNQAREENARDVDVAREALMGSDQFRPLRPAQKLNAEKIALGELLFNDKRLSRDNTVSCASCHNLKQGGVDGRASALGIGNQVGEINTPTVFNTALNIAQFWDGRAATLEAQAAGPVHNPAEMGSNWTEVEAKLREAGDLKDAFDRIYRNGIKGANIADAIAEFERSLITTDSPFDQWLQGKEDALSPEQKQGYNLFRNYGCASCHQGQNLGGNMFQKFGIFAPFKPKERELRKSDLGRFNLTGDESDKGVFRVPSLRNVAVTPPYFHDGSVPDLDTAVAVMGRVQLGREIPPPDRRLIIAFLQSLTGKYRGKPL